MFVWFLYQNPSWEYIAGQIETPRNKPYPPPGLRSLALLLLLRPSRVPHVSAWHESEQPLPTPSAGRCHPYASPPQ